MKVLKFGGTSVGSEEAIRQVGAILKKKQEKDQLAVVVSAVGGITNRLENIAQLCGAGDPAYSGELEEIRTIHTSLYKVLVGLEAPETIDTILGELQEICRGVYLLKELTPRSHDFILSCGERLSSFIISHFLTSEQLSCALFDSREYILTDSQFGNANVKFKETIHNLNQVSLDQINIFPGFVAATNAGETITLGRGGSDYTASILAKAYNASELEIWTDVDGLMTADPRLVKNARILETVSYEEALELSHFGAKVIYPPSIQPALEESIPIIIKNTFAPEKPGTSIVLNGHGNGEMIRGISSIQDIALLNLSGSVMVGIPKFSYRLFKALSDAEVNVILITQASSEHTICAGIAGSDSPKAKAAVELEFELEIAQQKINPVEIEEDLSILALVGSNMQNQVGVSGDMFHVLGKNGVSIKAIAQGSSERNISAVIPKKNLRKALNVLHESFFLSEMKRINLFIIGVGNVGKAFIAQLASQYEFLKEHHHLNIQVTGIASSTKMKFESEGINLEDWSSTLRTGQAFDKKTFISEMVDMNLRNSLFIDITAAAEIAGLYAEVLQHSISVVTPNKIAATGAYADYLDLKSATRRFRSQFLFETNVCAGLPVLSTLSDLVRSGDQVNCVEAVLSGTLNFLFNEYDGTEKFVDVIKKAKDLGFTEPDPRLDLFGEDVKRKILILIRESGFEAELDEIDLTSFLPASAMDSSSIEDFYGKVEAEEEHFKQMYHQANGKGCKLRVVARYKDQQATVALEEVDDSHPFYNLEGKDNIVLFYTNRYPEQPLVIKGAGAGADVTASGIFADVLRIAQSND